MSGSGGVLFDLDGTLTPRRASLEHFGPLFRRDFAPALGEISQASLTRTLIECDQGGYNPRRSHDLIEALPWRDAPSAAVLSDYWQQRFPDAVLPQPGLHEVLGALRAAGFRLGVVTNGGVAAQTRKLERLAVHERVDDVVISDAVGCKKPDARIFEIAISRLAVAAKDCWFVGDHPQNDVLGATRFGMQGVWITDPRAGFAWPTSEAPAAHRIELLTELLPIVGVS